MAGDLRRGRGSKPKQQSMYDEDGSGGRLPPRQEGPTPSPAAASAPQDRRPGWARDRDTETEKGLVTEEQAAEFRGFRLESLGEAFRLAAACVEGGVVPKGMTEGGVVAIWQRGFESGLQPMESLEHLYPINGRLGMYANKMLACGRKRGAFAPGGEPQLSWWVGRKRMEDTWDPLVEWPDLAAWPDELRAVMTARKASDPDREVWRSFSVLDAKQANKWLKDTDSPWVKYPKRQLRARALSFLMRDEFDEFTGGFNSVEELSDTEPREVRDVTGIATVAPDLGPDPALEPTSIERAVEE